MAVTIPGLNDQNDYFSSLQEATDPSSSAPNNDMGQEDFLRLLTTQLANQDPTDPVDAKDFVTDLTEMSQLESMTDMTASIQAMTAGFQSLQTMQAASIIGRNVQVVGEEMTHTQGQETNIKLSLSQPLTDVKVVISDDQGIVKEIDAGDMLSGENNVTWNGLDDVGADRASGQYTLTVYGTDDQGDFKSINTIVPSKVNSVKVNDDGSMTLTLATGEQVAMSAVREISI